ncbi:MAG: hypothetical protein M3Z26_09240 [Bacteroidota bacterium]|nr:hypothetical protein [Bacteroidota bacterium]
MKKIFTFLLLIFYFNSYSQDTTMVEQYCELIATGRVLSNKVTIDIDYGHERSFWNDHRLKEEDGKLKKFNTVVDAVNYLGKTGWKLVNAFPASTSDGPIYHYIFKKNFLKSETEQ